MRLTEIVESKPKPRKRRWSVALPLTALGASLVGFMSVGASATEKGLQTGAGDIGYLKQTAAQLPANCPGLKISKEDIATKERVVNGEITQQESAKLGTVILYHDVGRDGRINNLRVKSSTHSCFEAAAKTTVGQWLAEPQDREVKDIGVKLHFFMTGETIEDLKQKLSKFLQ